MRFCRHEPDFLFLFDAGDYCLEFYMLQEVEPLCKMLQIPLHLPMPRKPPPIPLIRITPLRHHARQTLKSHQIPWQIRPHRLIHTTPLIALGGPRPPHFRITLEAGHCMGFVQTLFY